MIAASLLTRVLDIVGETHDRFSDELLTRLRATFPGVHFSLCNDDDVPARLTAAIGNAFCHLYYVDSSAHCLQLTNDADAATGLLVGVLDPEESW